MPQNVPPHLGFISLTAVHVTVSNGSFPSTHGFLNESCLKAEAACGGVFFGQVALSLTRSIKAEFMRKQLTRTAIQ